MVERKRWWMARIDQREGARIIARRWFPARSCDKDDADAVAARITPRIGIDSEQRPELDVEAGFLTCLAYRRLLDRFADVDETAR